MAREFGLIIVAGIPIILVIIMIGWFIPMTIIEVEHNADVIENACKDLGFESYGTRNGFQTCQGYNGDIHFVKIDLETKTIWNYAVSATAKEVKVGTVEAVLIDR